MPLHFCQYAKFLFQHLKLNNGQCFRPSGHTLCQSGQMAMLFRFVSYLLENESGKRREVWEGGQSRLVGEDSERDESADKVKITSLLNI